MALSSVVVYLFTIVAVCLADGPPSSCTHGEYIRFANCKGYYHCVWGDPQAIDCPAGLVFSNQLKVCVWPSDPANDCKDESCYQGSCSNCIGGEVNLDLDTGETCISGELPPGISIEQYPTPQPDVKYKCSMMALLKVNFKHPNDADCRNLLEIELTFGDDRKDWMFNFGDSISNNGAAGDYYHQENDAEIDNEGEDIRIWGSDKCLPDGRLLKTFTGALAPSVSKTTFLIGNQYVKITNNAGLDEEVCHEMCLYSLAGQADSEGSINEDVFIKFNGVVNGDRRGYGTCNAKLHWKCID